jgi:TldD protein
MRVFLMSRDSQLDQVYDVFEKVGDVLDGSVEYWDALYDSQSTCIIAKDKVEEQISTPELAGVLLRAFKDGVWFSSSSYKVDKKTLVELAKTLIKRAPMPSRKIKLQTLKAQKIDQELPVKKDPTKIPLEEKLEDVRRLYKACGAVDQRIINVRVRHADTRIERIFANSEGSQMKQGVIRTRLLVYPVAREGDRVRADYITLGKTKGYEIYEETDVEELARKSAKSSIELLGAKTPPSGEFTVIVDGTMAGIVAHESFGHGLEADQVIRDRSYLSKLVGKKVASEQATIIDSSVLPGGYGSYVFDDDGVPAKENVLVERGILKGFLHDRLTASALESEPTSSSRVESFLTRHNVRMSNTYFAPGDMTLEELMEPIKYGVMLVKSSFGMEDPLGGGIQCTSSKGYMIENGETTGPLSEIALSGNVLDLLKNIDGAGKEFQVSAGTCGKGHEDYVPVGDGGGHLRIKKAIISGG